jgi:hypothetical protein
MPWRPSWACSWRAKCIKKSKLLGIESCIERTPSIKDFAAKYARGSLAMSIWPMIWSTSFEPAHLNKVMWVVLV